MEVKKFSLPEQLAINEILYLINQKKVEFVNMVFFSKIISTPLHHIRSSSIKEFTYPAPHFPRLFVQTEVSLFVREKKVAVVVVQGQLDWAKIPEERDDVLHIWRVSSVKALKKYWTCGPDESKEFTEFEPQHGPGWYPALSKKQMEEYESELRKFFKGDI